MAIKRSENSYINNDIIPLLNSCYGYPIHDSDKVRINDVPIFRPSGGRTGSTIDIVYYHNGVPLLLVEAKTIHKTHEAALKEALNYLRNFPKDKKEYSITGKKPKYLATTVGKDIQFYKWSYNDAYEDFIADPIDIIPFINLLQLYGLVKGYKPIVLTKKTFKSDFFDELIDVFLPRNGNITRDIIKKVSELMLKYLWDDAYYLGQKPYIDLGLLKQKAVRDLFNRYDLYNSLGSELAKEYRNIVLRAFQGGGFNQYMTEQCIIDFMVGLLGGISRKSRILDFECGSGGFLASVVNKFKLSLNNIQGVDIDELPFIVSKTYLAMYFKLRGREKIDNIPVLNDNGLFNYGDNWDITLGNPAGSREYNHGNEKKILRDGLKNLTGKKHNFSEYELSIQQAIRSAKIGGRICLILTESFFSNSSDNFLREFVAKNCRVKAIISLPRGIFKVGTSTSRKSKGSRTATMKMSILFAEKIYPVKSSIKDKIDLKKLDYNVFLASIEDTIDKNIDICNWLKPELDLVLENWKKWNLNS